MPEGKIASVIANKKILIVEDDVWLAKRLTNEFRRCGANVTVAYYVDSGLRELQNKNLNYHLVVVDVMLPQTEADFNQIQLCRKEVDKCDKSFIVADEFGPMDDKFKKDLCKTMQTRHHLLGKISSLINNNGGIEMIQKWISSLTKTNRDNRPAVLYLTALEIEEVMNIGKKAAENKNVEWLVKPVTTNKLISTAIGLLK